MQLPPACQGVYYEARVTDIDPSTRTLTCVKEFCEVSTLGEEQCPWRMPCWPRPQWVALPV